jgi:ribosome biogenesis GTPase A
MLQVYLIASTRSFLCSTGTKFQEPDANQIFVCPEPRTSIRQLIKNQSRSSNTIQIEEGIVDFLATPTVSSFLDLMLTQPKPTNMFEIRVAVIGYVSVGKTTVINALFGDEYERWP